jgi:nitroimidazol reductase NimA-like FMN-containing flavoprotein (pyridoxamine 5'-phosphate oxidase superfamily)
MRKQVCEMIRSNRFCVLATVSEGEPHCSLMKYAADEDCREIYMATLRNTKKYRNLSVNPSVSLLIDSRELCEKDSSIQARALTVNGTYMSGMGEQRKDALKKAMLARHPDMEEFFANPAAEVIVVRVRTFQLLEGITDAYFEEVS